MSVGTTVGATLAVAQRPWENKKKRPPELIREVSFF